MPNDAEFPRQQDDIHMASDYCVTCKAFQDIQPCVAITIVKA